MTDPRAIVAARNNADGYAMMFDVHDPLRRTGPRPTGRGL
jgi:hypothetical protein